jgi:hypothetical protein
MKQNKQVKMIFNFFATTSQSSCQKKKLFQHNQETIALTLFSKLEKGWSCSVTTNTFTHQRHKKDLFESEQASGSFYTIVFLFSSY